MLKCELCGKEYRSIQPLSKHIVNHNITKIDYYDLFLKKSDEGFCKQCSKPTHFQDLSRGYTAYCSKSCQVKAQNNFKSISYTNQWITKRNHIKKYEMLNNCTNIKNLYNKYGNSVCVAINNLSIPIIRESKMYQYIANNYIADIESFIENRKSKSKSVKILHDKNWSNSEKSRQTTLAKNNQFEKEHNCTQIGKLIKIYGQGWLSLNLPTIDRCRNAHFIDNKFLPLIQNYANSYHASNKEKYIFDRLSKTYKGKILHNTKRIISPYELDIYLPDLKLAIEFNGLYWHSDEHLKNKFYHLNKSLACRNLEIRLIHIYEFEDLDKQINAIIDLINGKDTFNSNDFNKNNLIADIPQPELIYDKDYHIYGAGALF